MKKHLFSIAIDGPCAVGKTTTAKELAKRLGFTYVDTGALYRTIALHALKLKQELNEGVPIKSVLNTVDIEIRRDKDGNQQMILFGEDVTGQIRTEEVGKLASDLSALPEVRQFLLAKQRRMAEFENVVMEGRDIGSVILPDANIKFYLTANPQKRADRRYLDAVNLAKRTGTDVTVTKEDVLKQLEERDHNDMTRKEAPLTVMPDAIFIDNSNLSFSETVAMMMAVIEARRTPGIRRAGCCECSRFDSCLSFTYDLNTSASAPCGADNLFEVSYIQDDKTGLIFFERFICDAPRSLRDIEKVLPVLMELFPGLCSVVESPRFDAKNISIQKVVRPSSV